MLSGFFLMTGFAVFTVKAIHQERLVALSAKHYGECYALCIIGWLINWLIAGVGVASVKGHPRSEEADPPPPPYTQF